MTENHPEAADDAGEPTDGGSLTAHVYEVISEMLLSGALKPGDRIPLRRLADQLGVSVMQSGRPSLGSRRAARYGSSPSARSRCRPCAGRTS